MAVTDFIAAIELGSTHITGIAGKKNADGSIQILAYANTPSSDCIKKGAIFNLDKTTQVLVSVIQKLEEDLQASIKKQPGNLTDRSGDSGCRTTRIQSREQSAD